MEILEYNQLTNHTLDSQSGSTGLGTIGATLSGKDIVVTYSPIAGVTTTFVNVLAVGFSLRVILELELMHMLYKIISRGC